MHQIASVLSIALLFGSTAVATYNLLPAARAARPARTLRRVSPAQVPSLLFRLLFLPAACLAPLFAGLEWPRYRTTMSMQLRRAGLGDAIVINHLLAMKAMTALVVPLLLSRVFAPLTNPALVVAVGVGCFFLPDRFVSDLRKTREHRILRALPGAVDVLSLSVEAGLEFLIAMRRLVERCAEGPLRDELTTILNDIRIGRSRADALKAFGQRVEIAEVSSFVSVLVQADMLGASIGPVLRQQAEAMRIERFQRAEKSGARATQKILFPLVLFIFPAVLIVIIGPVALQFVYAR